MMRGKIHLAESRGFCSGVERAVRLVDEALQAGPLPVRVLHGIVHNETVVSGFERKGVQFFENPDPAWRGGTLILSAHGVGEALEAQVRTMPLKVVDATCPLVKRLHARAAELENGGYSLLLYAKRAHRETQGVIGRLRNPPVILENEADLTAFVPESGKRYALLSQTTVGSDDFQRAAEILKRKIPDLFIQSGICHATSARQNAVRKLAEKCSRILVIGSEGSSNSKRLRETAEKAGAKALLVPDAAAIPESFLAEPGDIGITAGASVPDFLVEEAIRHLEIRGFVFTFQKS